MEVLILANQTGRASLNENYKKFNIYSNDVINMPLRDTAGFKFSSSFD